MKFTIWIILVLALLVLVAPVQAQWGPGDTMLVIDGTTMTLFGAIGLGVLIVVAGLLVNQRDMAAKLANSAPPWMETALTAVAGAMEGVVKQTPTKLDDDLLAVIRKEIAAAFESRDIAAVQKELAVALEQQHRATDMQMAPVVDVSEDIPPAGG
jgi:hypothetical protein